MATRYHPGDRVVFTRDKYTSAPSPRARNLVAAPNGESYQYQVDKYWVVVEVRSGGELLVTTRRGKTHVIQADNPQLRKASWWERLFKGKRFPQLSAGGVPMAVAGVKQSGSFKTLGSA